jgi:hypothetical protein
LHFGAAFCSWRFSRRRNSEFALTSWLGTGC